MSILLFDFFFGFFNKVGSYVHNISFYAPFSIIERSFSVSSA